MLGEIEGYSVRNRTRRDQKILEERKKQHESEHTKQKEAGDEVPELTVGGDAIPAKEVDPSLVGALEHVYEKPPGVAPQEDPFQNTIIDDKEKPVSLLEMEKSLDAMVTTSLGEDADSEQAELRGAQDISTADPDLLDPEAPPSAKQDDVLPDLVGTSPPPEKGEGAPPDVQVSVTMTPDVAFISHPQLPNLAANTQHAVDLLGEIGGLHQDTANQVLDHMN